MAGMTIQIPLPGGKPVVIVPDARRRIGLGAFAKHDLYAMTLEEGDVITLHPVEMVPIVAAKRRGPKPAAGRANVGDK